MVSSDDFREILMAIETLEWIRSQHHGVIPSNLRESQHPGLVQKSTSQKDLPIQVMFVGCIAIFVAYVMSVKAYHSQSHMYLLCIHVRSFYILNTFVVVVIVTCLCSLIMFHVSKTVNIIPPRF